MAASLLFVAAVRIDSNEREKGGSQMFRSMNPVYCCALDFCFLEIGWNIKSLQRQGRLTL